MRTKFLWLFALLMSVSLCLMAACKVDDPSQQPVTEQIEISRTSLTLDVLAREQLTAVLKDGDGNVKSGQISWESSNPAVATVQDGLVTALSAGTANITATSGENAATCALTVEANGLRPQIQLNTSSLDLITGGTEKIIPSVRFKTQTLDDSEYNITYSFRASEEGVASVATDGTVTALKFGTATVTVEAHWAQATAAGLDGGLTATVAVNVMPSYTLTAGLEEGYGADLYLQGATDGNNTYRDHTVITIAAASYKGQPIASGVEFKVSNSDIATVDENGKVTVAANAVEGDTVDVWLAYSTEDEGVLESAKITLTVRKAVIHKTLSQDLMIDLSDKNAALPIEEIFGSAEANVLSVYDADDAYKTDIGDFANVTLLGNRKWVVVGDKISYEIDVLAVTKVIRTVQDLAMFNIASTSAKDCFPGYYVLGNNIDASGWTHVHKGYNSADGTGLTGTFNGMGYTIDGLALGAGGLFGAVAKSGAVINVAFTNVTVNTPATNGMAVVFGTAFYGKMENVYVGIHEWYTSGVGSSACLGLFFQCNDNTVFRNVVVVNSAETNYAALTTQQYGTLVAGQNKGAWENAFVISDVRAFGSTSDAEGGDVGTTYLKSMQRFADMAELLASDYYTSHSKAFDAALWDTATMTFKSSAEYFGQEINSLPETIEIAAGSAVNVTKNVNAFKMALSASAEEAGVVLENGKLKATKISSSDDMTLSVFFGQIEKTLTVTVLTSVTLEDYTYYCNLDGGDDFAVTSSLFNGLTSATVKINGTDGNAVALNATIDGQTLTIAAAQFTNAYMPTGTVELTAETEGGNISILGAKFVYVINTADEFMAMKNHLTVVSTNRYKGYIKMGADIDLAGKSFGNATVHSMWRAVFEGEIDGGNHVLGNIVMNGSQSGAFFGTNYGTVKNVVMKNVSISTYGGTICYENYGTIENCYVKGSISGDGLSATSNPDNFGTGLLAGKNRNGSHVKNSIVELVSRADVLYAAGAFGKLGDGSAKEASIFENCYAVASANFALMTYSTGRTMKNFDDLNGNKNFASIFELFEDATAAALAQSLGLNVPVLGSIQLSKTELEILKGNSATLTATAYTTENEVISVAFTWTSTAETVASVTGGVVSGLEEGTATITVSCGDVSATCAVTVSGIIALDPLVLTDFTYAYNGTQDLVLTGEFPAAESITAQIKGLDGEYINLNGITAANGTLTVPAAQFKHDTMPTKSVEMTLYFDGEKSMEVQGLYLIYTVNTLAELQNMKQHMTADFDGHIILGADIDFTGVAMNTWIMKGVAFKGIFDGNFKTISNVTFATNAGQSALLGNMQAGAVAKNIIMTNVEINTYCGGISYQCFGTVQNCYVQGKIVKDGLGSASTPGNFGCGLLVGRAINATAKISDCIVVVTEHGTLYDGTDTTATIYGAAAFGMTGKDVTEAENYTNCYAVNADGFTLCSNTKPSKFSNFTNAANKNFADMADLFADEGAKALAESFGLTAPAEDGGETNADDAADGQE